MKKKTKKIIIGSAILLVLGVGSGITYYVVNHGSNNQETAIESNSDSATTTDVTTEVGLGDAVEVTTEKEITEATTIKKGEKDNKKKDDKKKKDTIVSGDVSKKEDEKKKTETKPSTTESSNSGAGNTGSVKPQTTEERKPESTTESPKPPKTQSSTSTEEVTTESTPTGCNHDWKPQYKTVTVPAKTHTEEKQVLVEEAWDEPTYVTHAFCGGCGLDFTAAGLSRDDISIHCCDCQGGSNRYTDTVPGPTIHHDAVYETQTVTVVDEPEHTEKVVNGYKCSICGATK